MKKNFTKFAAMLLFVVMALTVSACNIRLTSYEKATDTDKLLATDGDDGAEGAPDDTLKNLDWSEYFDLSDEKIAWDENIEQTNFIYVYLRKPIKHVTLTVDDFQNPYISYLEYINDENEIVPYPYNYENNYADKNGYRQALFLVLTVHTKEEVKSVIRDVEKLDFVKYVSTTHVKFY